MFKCQNTKCKKIGGTPITTPKQPANRIITEKRPKTYTRTIRKGKQRGFVEEIEGWEIVKEIIVCPVCYEKITGLKPVTAAVSLQQLMAGKKKKPTPKRRKKNFKNRKYDKPNKFNSRNRKPANDSIGR